MFRFNSHFKTFMFFALATILASIYVWNTSNTQLSLYKSCNLSSPDKLIQKDSSQKFTSFNISFLTEQEESSNKELQFSDSNASVFFNKKDQYLSILGSVFLAQKRIKKFTAQKLFILYHSLKIPS